MNNEEILKQAIIDGAAKVGLVLTPAEVTIDHSKDPSHGDYATNLALKNAKKLGKKPLDLANELKVGHRLAFDREDRNRGAGLHQFLFEARILRRGHCHDF
jgi:arginyl-tRNA synthetase